MTDNLGDSASVRSELWSKFGGDYRCLLFLFITADFFKKKMFECKLLLLPLLPLFFFKPLLICHQKNKKNIFSSEYKAWDKKRLHYDLFTFFYANTS